MISTDQPESPDFSQEGTEKGNELAGHGHPKPLLKRPCPVGEFVSLIDRNYRYVSINTKHAEAQNVSAEEIIGKEVSEIWGQVTFDSMIREHIDKCHSGEVDHYQSWFDFPKTGHRYWEVSYYPYREEGLEITHAMVVTRDLTEQKVATELLDMESSVLGLIVRGSLLHQTLSALRDRIAEMLPNSIPVIRTYNSRKDTLEVQIPLPQFKAFDPVFEPIIPDPLGGIPGSAAFGGEVVRVEGESDPLWRSIQIKGPDTPIQLAIAHPFKSSDGQLLGTVELYYPKNCRFQDFHSQVLDIAARVASLAVESHISKEEQARLGKAIEQTGECVILTGTDGSIQYVNPAFEMCTGFTKEEAVGQNISILDSGKQGFEFHQMFLKVLREGDLWSGRSVNKRKDGSLYENEATVTRMCNSEGKTTSYVFVQRDVTDRVNLENQLRHAQKMEAVGQLAGGVAHDFNNILQAIYGSGELVLSSTSTESRAHLNGQQILQSADRGAKLVRQLLNLSRRNVAELQKVNLNSLISDLMKMLNRVISDRVGIQFTPSNDLSDIWGDPGQIEQIILNLTMNAKDSMSGGGLIAIKTQKAIPRHGVQYYPEEPEQKTYVKLSFSDSGHGIPQDVKHRIFEPFFTTKEIGKGTGLGLSIVFRILKDHHGFISFESTPGLGTQFNIYFPIAPKGAPNGVDRDLNRAHGKTRGNGELVLVAEDDLQILQHTSQLLRNAGYKVLEAANGREAVDLYQSHLKEIRVAVLDVRMPSFSGKAVYEAIRRTRADLPVIFATSYFGDVIEDCVKNDSRTEILPKPFHSEELLKRMPVTIN